MLKWLILVSLGVVVSVVVVDILLLLMIVYMLMVCLVCIDYVEYLCISGFMVKVVVSDDMVVVKCCLKVFKYLIVELSVMVVGYFVEGYVLVDDIKELLCEKLKVCGLSVLGLLFGVLGWEFFSLICDIVCIVFDGDIGQGCVWCEFYEILFVKLDGDILIYVCYQWCQISVVGLNSLLCWVFNQVLFLFCGLFF